MNQLELILKTFHEYEFKEGLDDLFYLSGNFLKEIYPTIMLKTNPISRRKPVTSRCKQSDSIIQTICYQHFIMREFFTTTHLSCRCK